VCGSADRDDLLRWSVRGGDALLTAAIAVRLRCASIHRSGVPVRAARGRVAGPRRRPIRWSAGKSVEWWSTGFSGRQGQDASPLHPCHVESEPRSALGELRVPARNAGSLDPMSRSS